MDTLRPRDLKAHAATALQNTSYNPHRLLLIHTGVTTVFSLALYLLTFWLDHQISQTSGISGIGTRAIWETAQTILSLANLLLLPFWDLGLLFSALCMARGQEFGVSSLLEGFRRILPLAVSKLLQGLLLAGGMILGMYLGILAFSLTPLAAPLYEAMAPYMEMETVDYMALYADKAITDNMIPCLPFALAGSAIFALPMFYKLRMMDYLVLDRRTGGLRALFGSFAMMRKNRWKLAKVDLSFWWFYLLEGLVLTVGYGDWILSLLNVDLGMEAEVAGILFYAGALLLQLGLYAWKKPLVATTYAQFYDALLPKE